jgi:glycosyltransferase involved in cell wall biosynthesis
LKISILAPDLSSNSVGRAYILARVLQRIHKVEIVGPLFGKIIWAPVAEDKEISYSFVRFDNRFVSIRGLKRLYDKIDGDIIYAVKPGFTSFNIGLIKKLFTKKILLLDIDNWELGLFIDHFNRTCKKSSSRIFFYAKESFKFFLKPWDSFFWTIVNERLVRHADEITVSNKFLKNKFGGTILYHGKDVQAIDPFSFDKQSLKQKYDISRDSKIIMFLGTPKRYKGIEDLIEAVYLINKDNILLMLVGVDRSDAYGKYLIHLAEKKLKRRVRIYGLKPAGKIPEFLSLSDVVVIPQKKGLSTIGQIPSKIFDSMAMAKPTIATEVSELPEILNDCGWITEPDSPGHLKRAILDVLENREKAGRIGLKARQKCIENYSWDKMEVILYDIFKKYK